MQHVSRYVIIYDSVCRMRAIFFFVLLFFFSKGEDVAEDAAKDVAKDIAKNVAKMSRRCREDVAKMSRKVS